MRWIIFQNESQIDLRHLANFIQDTHVIEEMLNTARCSSGSCGLLCLHRSMRCHEWLCVSVGVRARIPSIVPVLIVVEASDRVTTLYTGTQNHIKLLLFTQKIVVVDHLSAHLPRTYLRQDELPFALIQRKEELWLEPVHECHLRSMIAKGKQTSTSINVSHNDKRQSQPPTDTRATREIDRQYLPTCCCQRSLSFTVFHLSILFVASQRQTHGWTNTKHQMCVERKQYGLTYIWLDIRQCYAVRK